MDGYCRRVGKGEMRWREKAPKQVGEREIVGRKEGSEARRRGQKGEDRGE